MVSSRIPAGIVDEIDQWAQKNETTRSDAIRRLVEIGLKAKGK
jgi:metal-responsive CopG/Arc/MetJ family transcriptional regulator